MSRRTGLLALAVLASAVVLAAVGGPAAVASYRHARDVVEAYGDPAMAPWLPLTTDGMIVAALIIAAWQRLRGQSPGGWTVLALVAGLGATLAANLAAAPPSIGGWIVAAWPPLAFAITLELTAVGLRLLLSSLVDTSPPVVEPARSALPEPPTHPLEPADRTAAPTDEDMTADRFAQWIAEPDRGPVPVPGPLLDRIENELTNSADHRSAAQETGRVDLTKSDHPAGSNGATVRTAVLEPDRRTADRYALRTADRRPKGWTAEDEHIRSGYADRIRDGGPVPTQRAVRAEHGVGPVRARRIVESLGGEADAP